MASLFAPLPRYRLSLHTPAWLIAAVAGFGGILFGYDMGVISGALLFLREEFSLSAFQSGLVVSSVVAGAVVGALATSAVARRVSRRGIIVAAALTFVAGAIVAALAPTVAVLVAARFALGLAIGLASTIVPLYVSEVAPPVSRGSLVAVFQLSITFGILVAYLVNAGLAGDEEWRVAFGLGAVPALILAVGILFMPGSPRYLVGTGQHAAARKVLGEVRDPARDDIDAELGAIEDIAAQDRAATWGVLRRPMARHVLVFGVVAVVLSQITGINTVIYYAPTIFTEAGIGSKASIFATAGIGVVNFVMTVIALLIIDRVRRRQLLIGGMIGMAVSMLALGTAFAIAGGFGSDAPDFSGPLRWLAVGSAAAFIACFAVSWGAGLWVVPSEIYPMFMRNQAMSVSNGSEWGANLVVALLFPVLLASWGGAPVFWLLAGFSAFAIGYLALRMPETKGKSLEQIEAEWRARAGEPAAEPAPSPSPAGS